MYSPVRLGVGSSGEIIEDDSKIPVTQIDIGRVFKGKIDKKYVSLTCVCCNYYNNFVLLPVLYVTFCRKLGAGVQNMKKKPTVSSAK